MSLRGVAHDPRASIEVAQLPSEFGRELRNSPGLRQAPEKLTRDLENNLQRPPVNIGDEGFQAINGNLPPKWPPTPTDGRRGATPQNEADRRARAPRNKDTCIHAKRQIRSEPTETERYRNNPKLAETQSKLAEAGPNDAG